DNQGGTERSLPHGIKFRSVQTSHDEEPRTSGRAYLYFWPGGMTERASVVLREGDSMADTNALTVVVSPLTGNVVIKAGAVSLPKVEDGKDPSEREDQGGGY
ncbi:MAG TPA: prepilin-type cleavage/methylation domain-containing protein, partial [Polyangiaceae bacterium]|nr:prepilin-type cleavage/methylation domain-containing protein [Polyangiaceae bacterium]